jgi:hypothetical protein
MYIGLAKFLNQIVWTCFLIYLIELSRETLPGKFLINKAVELAEFLIDLLKKVLATKF